MAQLAFKVVKQVGYAGLYTSAVVNQGINYRLDKITETPYFLFKQGYGILAFSEVYHANRFRKFNGGDLSILLVHLIEPMLLPATRRRAWGEPISLDHFVCDLFNLSWPSHTLMSRAVECLELL